MKAHPAVSRPLQHFNVIPLVHHFLNSIVTSIYDSIRTRGSEMKGLVCIKLDIVFQELDLNMTLWLTFSILCLILGKFTSI
jgi:hypothetical protein